MLSRNRILALLLLGLLGLAGGPESTAATTSTSTCATTTQADVLSGTALDTATLGGRTGTVFDSGELSLARTTGAIPTTLLNIADSMFMGCAADFDEDGWQDIVGSDYNATGAIKVYQNRTDLTATPVWTNTSAFRVPNFVTPTTLVNPSYIVEASSTVKGTGSMLCADFDNDGHQDFLLMRCTSGDTCTEPNRAVIFRGRGNGTFFAPYDLYDPPKNGDKIGRLYWEGTRLALYDYNGDGYKDLIVGLATQPDNGEVIALLNNAANPPKFSTRVRFLGNLGLGNNGATALAIADFTNDGLPDIVIGGEEAATFKLYPGQPDRTFSQSASQVQSLSFTGGAVVALAGTFSGTGKMDVVVASDKWGGFPGYNTFIYKNNASTTPFPAGSRTQLTTGSTSLDVDLGIAIDYDNDPAHSLDFIIGDASSLTTTYHVFANRPGNTFIDCGTATSALLNVGDIGTGDSSISEMRITPLPAHPAAGSGTVAWEATNDGGATWHSAPACSDNPDAFCAPFMSSSGHDMKWRATICSDTAHAVAPTLTSVATSFTYVGSVLHFRAGPVAQSGVIYVPGFTEPNHEGKFYAIDDGAGTRLWDAGALLDTNVARKVYTRDIANAKVELSLTNATALITSMAATDATQASSAITWLLSKRFGATTKHTLGAVINSTPAVLTPPGAPSYYPYLSPSDKTLFDTFMTNHSSRQSLVFSGSQDGALHAFYTDPSNPANSSNGKEAWAFVPTEVLQHLVSDQATGGLPSYYPDGSPTLADVKYNDAFHTVLVAGMGNGGRSIYALDVTDTISSGGVVGPTPLWSFTRSEMGNTTSKPAIIRVLSGTEQKFLAVFTSGQLGSVSVGAKVWAVDIADGTEVWSFDIGNNSAYIATDITAAETDDEEGTAFDGYVDRIFFGDSRGRLWKLDAAGAGSLGTINAGAHQVLFSTASTEGALGEERAIAGTLMAVPDRARRLVLYFGTGGTEETPTGAQNAFYAVYADTGEIRSKLDGSNGLAAGVKFYGGLVYNDGQIIFTRGQDLSGTSMCSTSAGEIVGIDAQSFVEQFSIPTSAKIVGPVYSVGGQVYALTLTGKLLASSPPSAVVAGGGTGGGTSGGSGGGTNGNGGGNGGGSGGTNGNGGGNGGGNGNGGGSTGGGPTGDPNTQTSAGVDRPGTIKDPFVIVSWRQVF